MGRLYPEDRAAIVEVLYLYARAIDAKELSLLEGVFEHTGRAHDVQESLLLEALEGLLLLDLVQQFR